mmetsp:Transcript_23934/g.63327  ORF Transcript_23934/g.63327 Transcript_23934/m.63327 type:complete len:351 (-) Transcript_23934:268-1320(-)
MPATKDEDRGVAPVKIQLRERILQYSIDDLVTRFFCSRCTFRGTNNAVFFSRASLTTKRRALVAAIEQFKASCIARQTAAWTSTRENTDQLVLTIASPIATFGAGWAGVFAFSLANTVVAIVRTCTITRRAVIGRVARRLPAWMPTHQHSTTRLAAGTCMLQSTTLGFPARTTRRNACMTTVSLLATPLGALNLAGLPLPTRNPHVVTAFWKFNLSDNFGTSHIKHTAETFLGMTARQLLCDTSLTRSAWLRANILTWVPTFLDSASTLLKAVWQNMFKIIRVTSTFASMPTFPSSLTHSPTASIRIHIRSCSNHKHSSMVLTLQWQRSSKISTFFEKSKDVLKHSRLGV